MKKIWILRPKKENKEEFKIGVVFYGFPEEVVIDETNKTSLKDEYLLNSEGFLEIWKYFRNGKLQSTIVNCNHPSNDDFLKSLLTKKIKELQDFVGKEKNWSLW